MFNVYSFNVYSAPTFAAMLLFWVMGCYVLTRSPITPVTLATVCAQMAVAGYLLGQGMQANATTVSEWRTWADKLQWGATIAPTLLYWLTALLLREQDAASARQYLRRVGYPLGILLAALCVVLTASIYLGDWLYAWDRPEVLLPARATFFRFRAPEGPLYHGFVALEVGAMGGAIANAYLAWRLPLDEQRHRRLGWLLFSAVLFFLGAVPTAFANLRQVEDWPTWVGHLLFAVAVAVVSTNVAAYSLVMPVPVIRADLLYFLVANGLVCLVYALVFLLLGPPLTFQLLGLLAVALLLAVLSHALVDPGRRTLDRLFFRSDVRDLRSDLSTAMKSAALSEDLGAVLTETHSRLEQASEAHFARLVEEALRALSRPGALATCRLIGYVPNILASVHAQGDGKARPTPLEQAQALREVLTRAVEQLKLADGKTAAVGAQALQYSILREEYVLGRPNKQIMMRLSIGEGTFNRNRREGIQVLARELREREALLASGASVQIGSPRQR